MCTSFHGGGVLFCLPQQERNLFLSQINVGIQGQNGGCRASSLHLLVQEDSSNCGQHTQILASRVGEGKKEGLAPSLYYYYFCCHSRKFFHAF